MSTRPAYGAQRVSWVADLGQIGDSGQSWHIVRRDSDGTRFLLQRWSPRPGDRELDQIKETYLRAFLDVEALDGGESHFGFDESEIWLMQALEGTPLSKSWHEYSLDQRKAFQLRLSEELARSRYPRLLSAEAIGLKPGRLMIPRVYGEAPWDQAQLWLSMPNPEAPATVQRAPWDEPRDLSEVRGRALRGRSQELTYLKSLMFGLTAPSPMERIVILQGEEGLGKENLAAWSVAAAETDGLWAHTLEPQHEEGPAAFLDRLLQSLLQGTEADLYAMKPQVARSLSRVLGSYAFLTGGRQLKGPEDQVEPEELKAALEAMDFANTLHPRLIHLSGLRHASPDMVLMLRDLIQRSHLPWLLCVTSGAEGTRLKPLLAPLKGDPAVAAVHLNRLEDEDLKQLLVDILGQGAVPEAVQKELFHRSLGNPGLLQSLLELAQQDGSLGWKDGKWRFSGSIGQPMKAHEDLVSQVLLGRLQRLGPASLAMVRMLALSDQAQEPATLGRALALSPEPLEEALATVASSRLVLIQEGRSTVPDPKLRELVISHTPQAELKRLARALLGAMQEGGAKPVLSVRLLSLASDESTALAQVMLAIEQDPPPPLEAQRVVEQALDLHPAPAQQSRLHEFLADAWAAGLPGGSLFTQASGAQPPSQHALEALGLALVSLEGLPETGGDGLRLQRARLLRKKAMQEIRLRMLPQAFDSTQAAFECLAEHPGHPEQPRLRLALGKIYLLQGFAGKGLRALEEGLQLLPGGKGQHKDQVAIALELGTALAAQCQFQRAASMLQSAQRLLEHDRDFRGLVSVCIALGQSYAAQGQPENAHTVLREALHSSRLQGDISLQAQCHLALGIFRSTQEWLGPALSHLDRALDRYLRLGDAAMTTHTKVWKARTLAALGDTIQAEHALLQALMASKQGVSPLEQGEQAFLQAEIAGYQSAWKDAVRLYKASAFLFDSAGLLFRQRLALLRFLQSAAHEAKENQARTGIPTDLEECWTQLEMLKGLVEGSGSRWLEMEWHRAHALLLGCAEASDAVAFETLDAWGEVLAAGREMRFSAVVLEASAQGADLLVKRGEKLGARSRLQDAFPSLQELWTRIPESQENTFLGRPDMHQFKGTVESCGLRFILPDRVDPLADWTPTQASIPPLGGPEGP